MPYKYIGRTTDFVGKTLWEILGNLKNHGVGRLVTRNKFKHYEGPMYYKILKVDALPNPKEPSLDDMRKVRVHVEKMFRGKSELLTIESASYKWDYRLIPKDEEEKYLSSKVEQSITVLPKTMDFPPVLRELLIREAKARGETDIKEPRLDIVYNKMSTKKKYRIAQDGEKPDVTFDMGLGIPASPHLYENAKLNQ